MGCVSDPERKNCDKKGWPTIFDSNGQPMVVPGYFKMRSRFVDFPGLYVLHCHILAHEDRGMMTIVEVQKVSPTTSLPLRHR